MANVSLSQKDINYIARVVDTEVPRSIQRRNPAEYNRMVQAVTDTVLNRMSSDQFPNTATGVLDQSRQFSKITGPSRLNPYGSVENTPDAPNDLQTMVAGHIADRAQGQTSIIGGNLNYANPNFSSPKNLRGWVGDMINSGAEKFGLGNAIHFHGTAPGYTPVGDYQVSAEGIPSGNIPTPYSPDQAPQSTYANGIMSAIDPVKTIPVQSAGLLPARTPELSAYEMSNPKIRAGLLAAQPPQLDPMAVQQKGLLSQVSNIPTPVARPAQPISSMPQVNSPMNQFPPAPTSQAELDALGKTVQRQLATRKMAGGILGGLLGGLALGPVGGITGGLLGRNFAAKTYYPPAPKSVNNRQANKGGGYNDLNERGRQTYNESRDFKSAVDSGKGGLW